MLTEIYKHLTVDISSEICYNDRILNKEGYSDVG